MCRAFLPLLTLLALGGLLRAQDDVGASCPAHQRAFRGSCFEFVRQGRSFLGAEAECERSGGHLAIIRDEDTQHFLQRHLDPGEDAWIGLASATSSNLPNFQADEGPISWLDGSRVTYSKWNRSPQPGAACGLIVNNSDFQWEATRDCNRTLPFVCQAEIGRAMVCDGRNTTLRCGSGQVLMIDAGFYGRKSQHYCRPTLPTAAASTEHRCGFIDAADWLRARCHNRQACKVGRFVLSSGDPCPQLGSYISVDYHCKNGLALSVSTAAAVFDDVTVGVKWLLPSPSGNITCKLNAGDGHVIYLQSAEGLEHSVVHRYTLPSSFVVAALCSSGDTQITAQEIITILEPVAELRVSRCYSGNLSFHDASCPALIGEPLRIQMEVKAGTNVTYRLQAEEVLLSSVSVMKGDVPHNVTVTAERMRQLGPGCHRLTLYASNRVTFPDVSTDMQVCVQEKIAGLEVTTLLDYADSPHIIVGVSLERGAPAMLHFYQTGLISSYAEVREMKTRKQVFRIERPAQGSLCMRLRAWNVFSYMEAEVKMPHSCDSESVPKISGSHNLTFRGTSEKLARFKRTLPQIIATPSASVTTRLTGVTLALGEAILADSNRRYQWSCTHPCKCQGSWSGLTHTIEARCLPDPRHSNKYHFKVTNVADNSLVEAASICITNAPQVNVPDGLRLTCTSGCNSENGDATIEMRCRGNCPVVVWNIEDVRVKRQWTAETRSCYNEGTRRPLAEKMNGGNRYTVTAANRRLAKNNDLDVVVVITSEDVVPIYQTLNLRTLSPVTTSTETQSSQRSQDSQEINQGSQGSSNRQSNQGSQDSSQDSQVSNRLNNRGSQGSSQNSQGSNQNHRGSSQESQGSNQRSQGSSQESQGSNQSSQGSNQDSQESNQGSNQSGQGSSRQSQGSNQSGQGSSQQSQGSNQSGQGSSQESQGNNQSGQGSNQDSQGSNQGSNQSGQGSSQENQGSNQSGQGSSQESQGSYQSGQGSNQNSQNSNQGSNQSGQESSQESQGSNQSGQGSSQENQGSNQSGQGSSQENQGSNQSGQGSRQESQGSNQNGQGSSQQNQGSIRSGQGSSQENQGSNQSGQGSNQDSQGSNQGSNQSGQGSSQESQGSNQSGQGSSQDSQGNNQGSNQSGQGGSQESQGSNQGGQGSSQDSQGSNQGGNQSGQGSTQDSQGSNQESNQDSQGSSQGNNQSGQGSTQDTQGSNQGSSQEGNQASQGSNQSGQGSSQTNPETSGPPETPGPFSCTILPPQQTILEAFNIICTTENPCPDCKYCFKIGDLHLRCGMSNVVRHVFLPVGESQSDYRLTVAAKTNNGSKALSTTITTQVLDISIHPNSSVSTLKAAFENGLDLLKNDDLLSGETIGQLVLSLSNKLNKQDDRGQEDERKELREQMLTRMIGLTHQVPSSSPGEVQVVARALSALAEKGSELSDSAQEEASMLLEKLSSSLLLMIEDKSEENKKNIYLTCISVMEAANAILEYSSNRNISKSLIHIFDHTHSALLAFKKINEGPTAIQQPRVSLAVNRVTPETLQTDSINLSNSSRAAFSLKALPSTFLPPYDSVDLRMLSLDKNLFSWNEGGNISGEIGSLSLSESNGTRIPVKDLDEDIEILLPRPAGEQANITVLDLGNYSTTVLHVPSADTTLVLKMVPSQDPLPFKLFIGHGNYPTDTDFVAMTEMPHQGDTEEERYTWLLDPKALQGNTGEHYLLVRPIVGNGIKSVTANLSITSIFAGCKFWDDLKEDWSEEGCRVGVGTTPSVTQCLCNHLTFFGSSFFVTPNLVDPSQSAQLFSTFADNPVVVCFVGALFLVYLLAVAWARWKDIQDTAKVKVTVLEDNNPMDEYRYLLCVSTGHRRGAGTSSLVTVTLLGAEGRSEPHHLSDPKKCVLERGMVDLFLLTTPFSLGDLQAIRLWHNNTGSHPAWFVSSVMVQDLQTEQKWHFLCSSWLAIDIADCSLDKVFPASTEAELKRFSNLFFTKTTRDFSDGHLWFSVISRPPSSTFTRVQRVSCCFSLLLCTMLTSIMFYGIPTDPAEQTMDLGHFEFTWQQFMIGVQSSLIMFPVNILIVSVFRNTRPRDISCCWCKRRKTKELEEKTQTDSVENITLEGIIKDLARLAQSLTMRNSSADLIGEGDLSVALSVLEDYIQKKSSDINGGAPAQQPGHRAGEDGAQMRSSKQYLYRQLSHVENKLNQLGSASSPDQKRYAQALYGVRDLKTALKDELLAFGCTDPDKLPKISFRQVDLTEAKENKKKRGGCCVGGLPWWFVFVGWLLVLATSVVAAYFTMLYGLKFGKERSISWLVSMIVSFFQSLLVIQPLKVLLLAVFFALVLKRVEEEDLSNPAFEGNYTGDGGGTAGAVRDSSLYVPPPAADIERMRENKRKEQKAFALLREILMYAGFMWMLLLVAYGQRDPNAFFLNRHIRSSFSRGVTNSMSLGEVLNWASTSLLGNLFGDYPGFITDGNSKLVGNARLRQVRVQRGSCPIADPVAHLVPDCHAPYSWEEEDTGSYAPGWESPEVGNGSVGGLSPWTYQTQAQLRAFPVWGRMVLYRGGGFVAELGPDSWNASRGITAPSKLNFMHFTLSTLGYLLRSRWLDVYTRAVFVEFTVYNANVNLFCIVTLTLETTAVGAFQFLSELRTLRLYQSTGGLHIFVMAAEIIYMLFILYYMFQQGKLMKRQRCDYWRSKWNLLELTIILLSWSAVGVFIKRTLTGNHDMTYYHNNKDQFASFSDTATADAALQYVVAFLVLLATIKLWHLLRLNPTLNLITGALQRAWGDICSFLMLIIIMLLAYAMASNLIYGGQIASYRTFLDALLTITSLQMGIFNYDEVMTPSPVLGALLFGSCIVFMTFVVVNLFVSVILVAFNEEQIHHKPSEEEEIVELMLKKVCGLFGIRYQVTPRPQDIGGSGSPYDGDKSTQSPANA